MPRRDTGAGLAVAVVPVDWSLDLKAVDTSASRHETVFVSGGRRGLDVELSPADLVGHLGASIADTAR